jgi:HlyD family secretion protein
MTGKEIIPKSKKKFITGGRILFAVVLVAVIAGIVIAVSIFRKGSTDADYLTATVDKGDIRNTVSATGTVQAVTTVQVGAQVTGRIQNLYADYNSVVHAGQIVAKLDPSTFEAQVQQARANLKDSQARLASSQSALVNSQASLSSAKANLKVSDVARDDAKRVLDRQKELATSGVITARDLESAQATYDSAIARDAQSAAQVEVSVAGVDAAKSAIKQAEAAVEQSTASLKLQEVNLDYTVIKTPIDGVVVSRSVDVGQTVAASLSAPTLFVIANDLRRMQLIANIDEADIGKISDKVQVRFTVDAFPGRQFPGNIAEIRLNSTTAQNVVTYNVIIEVNNTNLELKPGMTANIVMTVAESLGAMRVPNSALRFKPQDKTPEEVRKLTQDLGQKEREAQNGGGGNPGGDQQAAAPNGQTPPAGAPQAQDGGQGGNGGRGQGRGGDGQGGPGGPGGGRGGNGGGNRAGGPGGGGFPPIDTTGLSPAAADAIKKMRDPNMPREDRQAIMAGLSDADKQAIRAKFQMQRGPGQGGGPGGQGGQGGPGGGKGRGNGGGQRAGNANGGGKGPNAAPRGATSTAFDLPTAHSNFVASGIENEAANKIKFPVQQTGRTRPGIVWVLTKDKKVEPRGVLVGITDGQYTEIISSSLKEGDTVIIGQTIQNSGSTSTQGNNPFQQKNQGPGGMGGGGGPRPGGGGR